MYIYKECIYLDKYKYLIFNNRKGSNNIDKYSKYFIAISNSEIRFCNYDIYCFFY